MAPGDRVEHLQAVLVRQVEIEEDEIGVGLRVQRPQSRRAVGGVEDDRFRVKPQQQGAGGVPDEGVVVDDEELHGAGQYFRIMAFGTCGRFRRGVRRGTISPSRPIPLVPWRTPP
jgi:hypothetical protein